LIREHEYVDFFVSDVHCLNNFINLYKIYINVLYIFCCVLIDVKIYFRVHICTYYVVKRIISRTGKGGRTFCFLSDNFHL